MPASNTLVSLDQAKDWAKRLTKTNASLTSLSASQEAIAIMLGHASWHALTAFYAPKLPTGEDETFEEQMARNLKAINTLYPNLNAVSVEVLARETDEIDATSDELYERVRELENEGYFPEGAMDMAMKEMTTRVYAPPGHLMLRVLDAEGKAFMTVVDSNRYR